MFVSPKGDSAPNFCKALAAWQLCRGTAATSLSSKFAFSVCNMLPEEAACVLTFGRKAFVHTLHPSTMDPGPL